MRKLIRLAMPAISIALANIALAKDTPSAFQLNLDPGSVSTSLSLGWLRGEAREYVYENNGDYKLSQLNWKFKNTTTLKGSLAWDAFGWLTLGASGWTKIAAGNSHMVDYDWLNKDQDGWTHKSISPNTDLKKAYEYNLNVTGWLYQNAYMKLGTVAGLQKSTFGWTAYGGSYNYNNGQNIGNLPNKAGISYKQEFNTPYLGLAGRFQYKQFEINTLLKYSRWASASDHDTHHLRDIVFKADNADSKYYGAVIDAGYYITPKLKVYTEATYDKQVESRGGTHIADHHNHQDFYLGGDAAGISNVNYSASIGAKYSF